MITLCDEGTPGGPVWLWGGVGGMGRTPDELLGMGKEAGRRVRAVPCGMSTDCTSPLTDEHLGRFPNTCHCFGENNHCPAPTQLCRICF